MHRNYQASRPAHYGDQGRCQAYPARLCALVGYRLHRRFLRGYRYYPDCFLINSFARSICFTLLLSMDTKKPTPVMQDKPKTLPEKDKEQEFGGFENRPEPTRYGDWEVNGRCSDF